MKVKKAILFSIIILPYATAIAQSNQTMDVGSHQRSYGDNVRGYVFTAPCDFIITGLRVPEDVSGTQNITIAKFNTLPPLYDGSTNSFVTLGRWTNVPGNDFIDTVIHIKQGEIIGIYGQRGTSNSYGPSSGYNTSIGGNAVTLYRSGMQYELRATPLKDVWRETSGSIARVEMRYIIPSASYYVDVNATPGGSGLMWNDALNTVSEALQRANLMGDSAVEIWVKTGTYTPSDSKWSGRNKTFLITNPNVKIYGGFNGTEYSISQRNIQQNPTVLSGDIGTTQDSSDNTFHVVTIATGGKTVDTSLVIDGFTITGGNANGGSKVRYNGRGIYQHRGGGIVIASNDSAFELSPLIKHCTFKNNFGYYGGAIFLSNKNGLCRSQITSCIFEQNVAEYGTVYNYGYGDSSNMQPVYDQCVFANNTAKNRGAALYNNGTQGTCLTTITNCVIARNHALLQGGAIFNNAYKGRCETGIKSSTLYANNAGMHGGAVAEYNLSGTCQTFGGNNLFCENSSAGSDTSMFSEFYTLNSTYAIGMNYSVIQLDTQKHAIGLYNNISVSNLSFSGAQVTFQNTNNLKGNDGIWGTSDDGLIPTNAITKNKGAGHLSTGRDLTGATRNGTNPDIGAYEH